MRTFKEDFTKLFSNKFEIYDFLGECKVLKLEWKIQKTSAWANMQDTEKV
jgi:hypothetical protein